MNRRKIFVSILSIFLILSMLSSSVYAWQGEYQRSVVDYLNDDKDVIGGTMIAILQSDRETEWTLSDIIATHMVLKTAGGDFTAIEIGIYGYWSSIVGNGDCYVYVTYFEDGIAQRTDKESADWDTCYGLWVMRYGDYWYDYYNDGSGWETIESGYYDYGETWTADYKAMISLEHGEDFVSGQENLQVSYLDDVQLLVTGDTLENFECDGTEQTGYPHTMSTVSESTYTDVRFTITH